MQVKLSEYDDLVEKFGEMKTKTYWPSEEQIEQFESDPEKWIMFCIYNYEKGKKPETDEERKRRRLLSDFIERHLEIIEE